MPAHNKMANAHATRIKSFASSTRASLSDALFQHVKKSGTVA